MGILMLHVALSINKIFFNPRFGMSNPNRNSNKIRGPTSALTSFLRSKGINARNINAYGTSVTGNAANNETDPVQPTTEPEAPSLEPEEIQEVVVEIQPEEQVQEQTSVKRKAPLKKSAKKKKEKKADDESSDYEIEPAREVKYSQNCLKCLSEISKYYERKSINLCNDCADAVRKVAKSKSPRSKDKNLQLWQIPDEFIVLKESIYDSDFPSLVTICIKTLIENLDNVEDFGDLPEPVLLKMSKLICRYRKLDSRVLLLLIHAGLDQIYFPDCNQLIENDFSCIFNTCQFATSLDISFCSKLRNSLHSLNTMIPNLYKVAINGAYLASDEDWSIFFSGAMNLEIVHIAHASKLSLLAVTSLVESNKQNHRLFDLRLTSTNALNSECVNELKQLQSLDILDLSWTFDKVDESAWISLLKQLGPQLKELYLEGIPNLSDAVINEGIAPYCVSLTHLSLAEAINITVEAGFHLLDSLQLKLKYLNLRGCDFNDAFIIRVLAVFGKELEYLNINKCRKLTEDVHVAIAKQCRRLKQLDTSYLPLNDISFYTLKDNCEDLQYITCFGCIGITEEIAKAHYNRNGNRMHILGSEYQHLMIK